MTVRAATCLTLSAVLVCGAAALARAGDPRGPEFGSNRFEASIRPIGGIDDTDDFAGRLIEGESLSVTVAATKRSSVLLRLRVYEPSGAERDVSAAVKTKSGGRVVILKNFVVDRTGTWVVRVEGAAEASSGDYTAAFKVKAAKPQKLKKLSLGGADPLTAVHQIEGLEDGLLTLKLVSSKKLATVAVRSLRDPSGADVTGSGDSALDELIVKKTKAQWKNLPLSAGDGQYPLTLGIDAGTASYSLTWRVVAAERPKSRKAVVLPTSADPLLSIPPAPRDGSGGVLLRVAGANLLDVDTVYFGGVAGTVVAGDPGRTWLDVLPPAGEDDAVVAITVVSADGQVAHVEDYLHYVPLVHITTATVISGDVIGANEIPLLGGNRFRVSGAHLDLVTSVRLDTTTVTAEDRSATQLEFVAPVHAAGAVALSLTDSLGRVTTLSPAARYVGFVDVTGARSPIGGSADDFSAWRGAVGDLDNDTRTDDFAFASYNLATQYAELSGSNGTRASLTRVFTHTVADKFTDFSTGIPAVTNSGDWNASAVAVGDLDGNPGDEIVLAGGKVVNAYGVIVPTTNDHRRLRILINGGAGTFTAPTNILPPSGYRAAVIADSDRVEEVIVTYDVRSKREPGLIATAVALGDLDKDGDLDIVQGADDVTRETVFLDTSFVDYTKTPPYIHTADIVPMDVKYYGSALSIIDNDLDTSGKFKDLTATRVPGVGRSDAAPLPAFRARDIFLGDLDGDGDLDIAVTWGNPASVTPVGALTSFERYVISFGQRFHEYRYDSSRTPVVATRLLFNDGKGVFTDGTDAWMPPPLTAEHDYWQGHRVRLSDLDGDGDLDMVILHRRALDAYRGDQPTYTRSSLRVLRNDRIRVGGTPQDHFVDVTATALPPFPAGSDDNFRGTALEVKDVNRDGRPDIVFGSREAFSLAGGGASPSTHVLFGRGDLTFVDGRAFLPPLTTDTGEADFYLVHDFSAGLRDSLIILSETKPAVSTSGQSLRVFDWLR